jgi:hypothetical protein
VHLVQALLRRVVALATKRLQILDAPHAIIVAFVRHDVIDHLSQGCPADRGAPDAQRVGAPVLARNPIPPARIALRSGVAAPLRVVALAVASKDWRAKRHERFLLGEGMAIYTTYTLSSRRVGLGAGRGFVSVGCPLGGGSRRSVGARAALTRGLELALARVRPCIGRPATRLR